jgi:hypothetical protein
VKLFSLSREAQLDDLGLAFVMDGQGYVSRVERTCAKLKVSIYNVLAVAIAHELAHMLLPTGWHAKQGLMQPFWDAAHFRSASAGLLLFSVETGTQIRRGLIQEVSVAAARQPD